MNPTQRQTILQTIAALTAAVYDNDISAARNSASFITLILARQSAPRDTYQHCVQLAAAHYHLTHPALVYTRRRDEATANARQFAMFLAREITGDSYETIGAFFARDHGTVLHACRAVQNRLDTEPQFRTAVEQILTQLKNNETTVGTRSTRVPLISPSASSAQHSAPSA